MLTRQSSPRLSPAVRRELESATRARLQQANVTACRADFYAESAQLMHEARRRRGPGKPPDPYPERAQRRALKGTDEALGLGLWGLDYEQRTVTLWASSDRIHVDPSTIVGIPLAWGSEWVAIEAITQGSVVEWDPEIYASRWRSVRGIPLVWTRPDQRERIIVGAATLTSTRPLGNSILDRAEVLARWSDNKYLQKRHFSR